MNSVHATYPRWTSGTALLTTLILLLVISSSSMTLVWFMNQQQTRAGGRFRSAAALAISEAGVHRALSILETVAPDGTIGSAWRPSVHSEVVSVGSLEGRFTLSLVDQPDAAVSIMSTGEVAGNVRRLRARAYLASPALLAALYGPGVIRLNGPNANVVILPYHAVNDRPWVHIAAGGGIEVWHRALLNEPSTLIEFDPGPVPASNRVNDPSAIPARVLLARGTELSVHPGAWRPSDQARRALGLHIADPMLRADVLPQAPKIDQAFFQALAVANTANAWLNEAAGRHLGDGALALKRDSLYSGKQFYKLLQHLKVGSHPPAVQGIVYVDGLVELDYGQRLRILNGALVTKFGVVLEEGSSLEVTHTASTRTLPAILVSEEGRLDLGPRSRIRAHGLVYASSNTVNTTIAVGEGHV